MVKTAFTRLEIFALLEKYPVLQQTLRHIKQVVWVQDPDTDYVLYVSPAFELVWGRPCESFIADPLIFIMSVHPEDRVKVLTASLDDARPSTSQIFRIMHPDGKLRWISAHTFLIRGNGSELTFKVSVAEDVTDQHLVDETLRKALDRSREQFTLSRRMSLARKPEVVLKTLMSASELRIATRAFVLFFDPTMGGSSHEIEVIAAWSPAPNLMNANTNINSASPAESILFEEMSLLDLFHPSRPVVISEIENDERLTPPVRILLMEEKIQTAAIFPLVTLGKWLGCLLVFFSIGKHFEPIELRHIKVLVDQATITLYNLQLLEIEAESRHEAERANEIKTEFLAMISHELRTPLTSILGFTTTLLAEDVAWDRTEEHDFIQTIQQEAYRLEELIEHLLDLSRLEAGMLPITQDAHSLNEIIADALPQIHVLSTGKTLTLHIPANLPDVYVDAKRIAQVLVNLVRNAATYAPKDTEINISASTRGGFVRVNVNDQGPGIPTADQKRVFQAFRRGINSEIGPAKGAGLGLAICKGLVEAHGGRIWIKKKNTPGATISFTLPLVAMRQPAGEER